MRIMLAILFVLQMLSGINDAESGVLPNGFAELRLAEGLDGTTVNHAPDGRLFITQKKGLINIISNGVLLPDPFLDLQGVMDNRNERGLQSMTFDPDFASNGFIYVYYCRSGTNRNRVSRFTANGNEVVSGSEFVLLELDALSASIHNGGGLFFKGGKLFICSGDGGDGSNAPAFTSLLGKVLRINKDGSVPADNPFADVLTGNYRLIYALGFRNPFRTAVQPGTERVFINDVGAAAYEEINELFSGKNYGWPSIEGKRTTQSPPSNYQDPLYSYNHSGGACSIGGGAFYNPTIPLFPVKYIGKYFFGDYCGNFIKVLDLATGEVETFATNINRPISFSVAANGDFYYLARGGLAGGSAEANSQSCCSEVWKIMFTNSGMPTVSAQPSSQLVAVGGTATFAVGASGNAPLLIQWQRNGVNIPDANSYIYEKSNITLSDHGAVFRAVITNPLGSAISNGATLSVTTNLPPQPSIELPTAGTLYTAGTVLNFSGTAIDPEDGELTASAFTWEINFHHDTHTHPAMAPVSGISSGSYSLSSNHDPAVNVWYRVYLTVHDSQGQSATVFRDIHPSVSTVSLSTNHPGVKLKLDGTEVTSPFIFDGVAGIQRNVEAPSPQTLDGVSYNFFKWSDDGDRSHPISTPEENKAFVAYYLPVYQEAESASLSGVTARWSYAGFKGTGYADFDLNSGGYIEWSVFVPQEGHYKVNFRYSNGSTARPLRLTINGEERSASLLFARTAGWSDWNIVETMQPLVQGMNTIRITSIGSNGPNIDCILLYGQILPVATPVFSPGGGDYPTGQQVTITTSTPGAVIHYTLDGSVPTTSSPVYSSPLSIYTNTTLSAMAVKPGMTNSTIRTDVYEVETPPGSYQYEAEAAMVSGVKIRISYAGFTGTGYVDYEGDSGSFIKWEVTAPYAGEYRFDFRYGNASHDRPLIIAVNNVIVDPNKSFPRTTSWTDWRTVSGVYTLNAGINTIEATSFGFSGPNIDHLVLTSLTIASPSFHPAPGTYIDHADVTLSSTAPDAVIYYSLDGSLPTTASPVYSAMVHLDETTTIRAIAVSNDEASPVVSGTYIIEKPTRYDQTFEAESATRYGVTIKANHAGYTGTGFGDYINAADDYLEWNINVSVSGVYAFAVRYALPTGNRPLGIKINNVNILTLSFPATGAWENWNTSGFLATLSAGLNTLQLSSIGSNGPNIDHVRISNTQSLTSVARYVGDDDEEEEVSEDNALDIYPVPADDFVSIIASKEIRSIKIIHSDGRNFDPVIEKISDRELNLNIESVPAGLTILIVDVGGKVVRKRVVIKR